MSASPPSTERLAITLVRRDADREPHARPLDLGLIRRVFRYAAPYRRKRNWLIFLTLTRAIQLPTLAWAIGAVINGPIANHDAAGVFWGTAAFLAFAALTNFTFHFRMRLALELGEAVVHDLRNDLFAHLQRLPVAFHHRTKLGRIISRMMSDAEAVRVGVQDVLFVGLVGGGQMVVSGIFMAWCDGRMFLIVAAMAPLFWFLTHHFRRRLAQAYRDVQESFSRVTATLAESVNGVRVTQSFARQETNSRLFADLADDHARYNISAARTAGVFMPLLELNSQVFLAVLLALGGYLVLAADGSMPLADLIQFFFLATVFFGPIQHLGNQYNAALTAMAGAERVFRLLDTPPDWEDPPTAQPLALRGRVEFRNVSFGYDPRRLVLHNILFTAEPGQTIALVGHTGSGKTTIVNLIAKFYLPTSGELLLDGREIRDIATDSLHRQLGIVWQHNFLFDGTVAENIQLGRPGATAAEALAAAEQLGCADLLAALPNGFETRVGERGGGVSLGQRQLICFARAMLADPRILLLDEATSSVDSITEHRVQAALARLLAGRTSFVVAHRLSTIRGANLVLVLDHGRIVERGTHSELVAHGGVYARLHHEFVRATTIDP